MKLRNPWIDPRVLRVRPEEARAYLDRKGWKLVGPAENPALLLFDPPEGNGDHPGVLLPLRAEQGPEVQWLIDLITDLARFEDRYAGDVISEILAGTGKEYNGVPAREEGGQTTPVP
jgi:hypothetical protein